MITAADQKTYSVAKPTATHTRKATCTEVDCVAQSGGFVVPVDENTDLGQGQAHYIRTNSGRAFTESRLAGLTSFTFPPGERCFAEHRVSLDRPEFYSVGELGRRWNHSGPDPWLNDCGEHLDTLRKHLG